MPIAAVCAYCIFLLLAWCRPSCSCRPKALSPQLTLARLLFVCVGLHEVLHTLHNLQVHELHIKLPHCPAAVSPLHVPISAMQTFMRYASKQEGGSARERERVRERERESERESVGQTDRDRQEQREGSESCVLTSSNPWSTIHC